jgi:hypothetical protein
LACLISICSAKLAGDALIVGIALVGDDKVVERVGIRITVEDISVRIKNQSQCICAVAAALVENTRREIIAAATPEEIEPLPGRELGDEAFLREFEKITIMVFEGGRSEPQFRKTAARKTDNAQSGGLEIGDDI